MDVFVQEKLQNAARNHGFDGRLFAVDSGSEKIRLGMVLDSMQRQDRPDFIEIGAYKLNVHDCVFQGRSAVRLTEKEVGLLVILHAAGGAVVSREQLLRDVWEYADNVETHTLETHIYRLRQKIEVDPSVPQILKTAENGYYLGGC